MIRFIDLFAGIGGFRHGLEKVGEHLQKQRTGGNDIRPNGNKPNTNTSQKRRESSNAFDCVYSNEWDKYAAQIYDSHFKHASTLNQDGGDESHVAGSNGQGRGTRSYGDGIDTRDIRTVKSSEIPDFDLLVGGFPCQAFSIAGKRKGFDDTRGTLFFEIARILADKRPRYFILENVKGLLSHDEGKTFQTILGVLSGLGYEYQWQVLNSKNFGVPQNRERVFIIGHLRGTPRPKVFPIGKVGKLSNEANERKPLSQSGVRGEISSTIDARYGALRNSGETYMIDVYNKKARNESPTLTEPHHNSIRVMDKAKIRRLTPTECERLQGFEDGWTEGVSDTQRYKMLGNAVTTNVVTEIGKRLIA